MFNLSSMRGRKSRTNSYLDWEEYRSLIDFLNEFNFSQMVYQESMKNL